VKYVLENFPPTLSQRDFIAAASCFWSGANFAEASPESKLAQANTSIAQNGHHMCSHLLVPQTTPSSLLIFFSERESNVRSGRVASDATRP
jgi:hypothetical protein